jgi:hypothetical protein
MAKRYQRGNQNTSIKEGQTTQWLKDTKEVIRRRQSKKDRQHNGQKKKYKQRSTNTTQKTKNWG